ncbi:MAG: sn-glycerol-1-phosphate dehydrogenase [Thermoguttaceae bacterium]
MSAVRPSEDELLLQRALAAAARTRLVRVEPGVRRRAAAAFEELFGPRPAVIVADTNTFAAAGRDVADSFRQAGRPCLEPLIFDEPDLHAEFGHVEAIARHLGAGDAIAVAVGSGTINDMTKLASEHCGRPYLCVATAASMDGYTAFGASITREGSKQSFDCAAPVGVLADLEVIEAAPEGMNASGYADLLAKIVAGADWIVAEALGVEPIDPTGWEMMHGRLRSWVANPGGIRQGDPQAVRCLVLGLLVSGLAMQWTKTSRVASGADHQFSHLWDMEGHVYRGKTPSHGFKVGIGTLASSALYEQLLPLPLEDLEAAGLAQRWPDISEVEADIERRFALPEIKAKALLETRAKYVGGDQIREQIVKLHSVWPELRGRLQSHLLPLDELANRLAAAGCPVTPEGIGIAPARLKESYRQAYYLRRRFTVLDLAERTGLFESALERIFGPGGRWPIEAAAGAGQGEGHTG